MVGVDRRASGVARARALATLLEIDNVSFAVANLAEASEVAPAGTIDLAVSTLTLREVVGPEAWDGAVPENRGWTLAEVLDGPTPAPELALAERLRAVLAPEVGRAIVIDRLLDPPAVGLVARALAAGGLGIDWSASHWLRIAEPAGATTLPLLIAKPAGPGRAASRDILAFCLAGALDPAAEARVFGGAAAEALFESLASRALVAGVELAWRDGSGRRRREIWRCGPFAAVYDRSDNGDRWLRLEPALRVDGLINDLRWFGEDLDDPAAVEMRRFTGQSAVP